MSVCAHNVKNSTQYTEHCNVLYLGGELVLITLLDTRSAVLANILQVEVVKIRERFRIVKQYAKKYGNRW